MTMKTNFVQSGTDTSGSAAQPFDYTAAAAEVNKALDTIEALVPKFLGVQENSAEFVRRRKSVPVPLVEKAIATAEQNEMLHPGFNVADAQAALEFQRAFRPIQARMKSAERDLAFSLNARLMEVGRMTLEFYAVAKAVVARTPNAEGLASQVEGMKASLPQSKRQLSPAKAAEKAARDAARADQKAAKAAEKAAAKAAKVPGTKAKPAPAPSLASQIVPGPM
jgi:hypothetical protein